MKKSFLALLFFSYLPYISDSFTDFLNVLL
ncbi:hypothetical protein SABVI_1643 [Streptococcus anginosus]|nr:hypothetical protein SABVI_1643 [Streptococcus anginosus]